MIEPLRRTLQSAVLAALARTPAVALIGPRQVGKTTLALSVGEALGRRQPHVYLDLESASDRAKLDQAELYLADHRDKLVILDEVHRAPDLFPILRGQIDRARRAGRRTGLFLLLGSASMELLRQSGESLAGRLAPLELAPFALGEAKAVPADTLWLRGGFPESLLAANARDSAQWRRDFIRTYLERDVLQFSPRAASETLRRLWVMLAHRQGGLLNAADLARNLAVDGKTVAHYVHLLVDLMLLRRLPPWHANVGKRLVRAPKLYVRDSGLLHSLLGIGDREALMSHPVVGASWEGWVIENLIGAAPQDSFASFYRSTGGAEIDLLLELPGGERWAIEVKRSLAPKLERGFHFACVDVKPARKWVVYPGEESFAVGDGVSAVPLGQLMRRIRESVGR